MVCIHTCSESDNALLRYGRLKFSKMAAGHHLEFDPNGNGVHVVCSFVVYVSALRLVLATVITSAYS